MQPLPYQDFTIKAHLRARKLVEKHLLDLGFGPIGLDQQCDTYFQVERGRLKLRQGTIENLITHYERPPDKNAEKIAVYRYDKNPSAPEVANLYAAYRVLGVVEKSRDIYRQGNAKIHLDRMASGEEFLETEVFDYTNALPAETLESTCHRVRESLKAAAAYLLPTGYYVG